MIIFNDRIQSIVSVQRGYSAAMAKTLIVFSSDEAAVSARHWGATALSCSPWGKAA